MKAFIRFLRSFKSIQCDILERACNFWLAFFFGAIFNTNIVNLSCTTSIRTHCEMTFIILDDSKRLDPAVVTMILQLSLRAVSVMNSFWIELDGVFCQTKINFTKPGPLQISKMKIFVTIVDSWNLLTSIASSLDPPLLNYDFQKTEEGCSDVASLVVYVDGGRHLSVFIPNPKFNQDFN